jgi:hypothetical protein
MGIRGPAKRFLVVVAALAFGYAVSAAANPIAILLDTTQLNGQTFIVDFQLIGSATDSVAVTQFSPSPDGNGTADGDVTGSLETNDLVLTGGAAVLPSEYRESVTLGSTLSFALEATTAGGNDLPALFAFFLLDPQTGLPPVDDATSLPLFGDRGSGVLLTYEFGTTDAPVLTTFSTPTLPFAAPEPGAWSLVLVALLALGMTLVPRRTRPGRTTASVTR